MPQVPPAASYAGTPTQRPRSVASCDMVAADVTTASSARGALWIDAGQFSVARYADQMAQRLHGSLRKQGRRRSATYQVRVGPFNDITQADAALDRALSAGVTGARIIVE